MSSNAGDSEAEVRPTRRPRRGDELVLEIEQFADKGKSLARIDGYVVFVPGAVPGDVLRASVSKSRKGYAEARMIELIEPSVQRVEPRCRYAHDCGGCSWQHVRYADQLRAKEESVAGAFRHAGGLEAHVSAIIPAEHVFFYRNKMEFSFGSKRWLTAAEIASDRIFDKSFALGMHVPGAYDKIIDLEECFLQSELSVRLLNRVREYARGEGLTAWNVRNHTGLLRHLVIRRGEYTGATMVILVTSSHSETVNARLAEILRAEFPEVTTLVNTINDTPAQVATGSRSVVVFGPGVIREKIGRFEFEIAPNAFFQTNTHQARRLYDEAVRLAGLRSDDVVYDLYCGAGTIAIYISDLVRRVVGIEIVDAAVENARVNVRLNGVQNCEFYSGDVARLLSELSGERPRVVIVDPPRAGMDKPVVGSLLELGPERIVYISCNPQTQARDIALLAERYDVIEVRPVDMFPHTYHIESVAALELRV